MSLFSIANFDESMTSLPSGGGECNIIEVDTLTELKTKTADEALGKIYFVKKDESSNDLNQYYVYDFTKSQFITLGEGGESVIKVYEYLDELPYPASLEEFKAMFGKIYYVKKIRWFDEIVNTVADLDSLSSNDLSKVLADNNIYKYDTDNSKWVIATAGTDYEVINENSYFVANTAALKDWIALGKTEESFDIAIKDESMNPYTALITDSISLETMSQYFEDTFSIVENIDNVTEEGIIYYVINGNIDYSSGYYYFYKEEPHYIDLTSMKTLPALVASMYTKMHDPVDTASNTFISKPTTVTSIENHDSTEKPGDVLYTSINEELYWNRDILFTGIGCKDKYNGGSYFHNYASNLVIANNIYNMTNAKYTGTVDINTLIAIFSGYPMITGTHFIGSGDHINDVKYNYAFKIEFFENSEKGTSAKCYYLDVSEDVKYVEATNLTAFKNGVTYYTKEGDAYTAVTGDFVSGTTYYTQEPVYTPIVKVETYAVSE